MKRPVSVIFMVLSAAVLLVDSSSTAVAQAAAPAPISAAPGRSGGEGGGFGRDVTLKPATKEEPFLQTIVGQPSAPPSGNDSTSRCLRVASTDFTGIAGAPTSITEVTAKQSMDGGPMICVVNGYVAPQVGFRLLLPLDTWNGKYMQNGCGGACGDFIAIQCEVQVTRGYACLAHDLGHKGTTYDSVWAIDDLLAELDSGFRATHVAALAGKAITEKYYGQAPKYSYFIGASTGGRQALTEAQRFPLDFDGAISGEGGPGRFVVPGKTLGRGGRALYGENKPALSPVEVRNLHRAVIARCDADDGLKDGIITDPRACGFKPEELLCKAEKTDSCLTPAQVSVLNEVYSSGPQLGSELAWIGAYIAADGSNGRYARPAPAVAPSSTFSFPSQYRYNGNPDLEPFKARGGKFILYSGWADEVVDPIGPVQYYEKVERLMGGRANTQDFFRLFMIPGQSHIPGNVGAESMDYVQAMEDWVEKGVAPDVMVGHKLKWITQMMGPMYLSKDLQPANYLYSRPHYPYPIQARYKGKGDPDDAASFAPWDPVTKRWVK
jgi:feruloyl esterase